jgi:hypothetical protein
VVAVVAVLLVLVLGGVVAYFVAAP